MALHVWDLSPTPEARLLDECDRVGVRDPIDNPQAALHVGRSQRSPSPPLRLSRVPVGTRYVNLHDIGCYALVVDNELVA